MKSHKVVGVATVTSEDDPVSQRHGLIGAKQMYEQFISKGIYVDVHGHDINASVNNIYAKNTHSFQMRMIHGIQLKELLKK